MVPTHGKCILLILKTKTTGLIRVWDKAHEAAEGSWMKGKPLHKLLTVQFPWFLSVQNNSDVEGRSTAKGDFSLLEIDTTASVVERFEAVLFDSQKRYQNPLKFSLS